MANKHTVSGLQRQTIINDNDLFLVSKTLNKPYNTQWQSVASTARSVSHCFADMIAANEYKDKFDTLDNIYCSYLNNDNLTLVYSKDVDSNKYYLALSSEYAYATFGKIEVNDFVIAGMLNNAEISAIGEKKYLVLAFNTVKGEKKISVDMTDFIDVYTFTNGLSANNGSVSVDFTKVAKKDHVHLRSEIKDFPLSVSLFINDSGYINAHRTDAEISAGIHLSDYAKSNHVHALTNILSTTYQRQNIESTIRSVPTDITLNVDVPIQIYYSSSQQQLNFSRISANATEDGTYTWELMINSDVDMDAPTFGTNITYVGKDKDTLADSMKRIDLSSTIHVFSVRLIKVQGKEYWQMNYCYSFKK